MKKLRILFILCLFYPISVFAYTNSVVDITKMSITDLSEALDKGYLTSELLVTLYLERINAYNDEFNAIEQINTQALEEAKKLDKERSEGHIRSKLHGIPIVVKANIDVQGLSTTASAKALSDNKPLDDALVVQKLKDAGAIILGNTNMSEFAFAAGNSKSSYGTVKNAFNTKYTPYGSSGGSAVAVALSFAAAALGTDTNASVRLPASGAGLVGLRPTFGLNSTDGVIPYDITRDTVGILTKTVEDNALILSIINEDDKEYQTNLDSLKGIKIGVVESYVKGGSSSIRINQKTDEDIYNLTKEKIKLLEDAGAKIVYIDELVDEYYYSIATSTMSGDSFCDGFNEYIKGTTGLVRSFQSLTKTPGRIYSLTGYLSGCHDNWLYDKSIVDNKKQIFKNHIDEVFTSYDIDLLVYPTLKNKVFTLNSGSGATAPGSFLGSVIGYPSLTVPMGYIEDFPYGLEFFSYQNSEETLYQVASVFESVNNLELTNSPLAPSLYEVPNYISKLTNYYEQENNSLTAKTKEYFMYFSDRTEEENESLAYSLTKEYENLSLEKEKEPYSLLSILSTILLIVIFAGTLVFIIISYILIKKIKIIYQKLINKDSKIKKSLLK